MVRAMMKTFDQDPDQTPNREEEQHISRIAPKNLSWKDCIDQTIAGWVAFFYCV